MSKNKEKSLLDKILNTINEYSARTQYPIMEEDDYEEFVDKLEELIDMNKEKPNQILMYIIVNEKIGTIWKYMTFEKLKDAIEYIATSGKNIGEYSFYKISDKLQVSTKTTVEITIKE